MIRLTSSTWVLTFYLSKPVFWTCNYEKYLLTTSRVFPTFDVIIYFQETLLAKIVENMIQICALIPAKLELFKNVYIYAPIKDLLEFLQAVTTSALLSPQLKINILQKPDIQLEEAQFCPLSLLSLFFPFLSPSILCNKKKSHKIKTLSSLIQTALLSLTLVMLLALLSEIFKGAHLLLVLRNLHSIMFLLHKHLLFVKVYFQLDKETSLKFK